MLHAVAASREVVTIDGKRMIYQAFMAQKTGFDLMRPFASALATTMRLPSSKSPVGHR